MSLKSIVILTIAGLVAQATAFIREDDDVILPGFSYTADANTEHGKLSMVATDGILNFLPHFRAATPWKFLSGPAITQTTSFPVLGVSFYGLKASAGQETSEGSLFASFGRAKFTLTLSATGDDKECKLDAKVTSPQKGIYLTPQELWEVEKEFRMTSAWKEVESTVWEAEVGELPELLTELVNEALPKKVDTNKLCKQILAAKPNAFPKPKL